MPADLVADRRLDLKFAPGFEAKVDFVPNGATDPLRRGYACDGDEAHPRYSADDVKNLRDRTDLLHSVDIGPYVGRHVKLELLPFSRGANANSGNMFAGTNWLPLT
jgi:hypothetical protein